MYNIIRIDNLTVIDQIDVISYDLVSGNIYRKQNHNGVSSRGLVKESHIERTLVIFNKFKIKLKS